MAQIIKMKFKNAPIGARFSIIEGRAPRNTYVKVSDVDDGLIAEWHGNEGTLQLHYSWIDDECGWDTIIDVIE